MLSVGNIVCLLVTIILVKNLVSDDNNICTCFLYNLMFVHSYFNNTLSWSSLRGYRAWSTTSPSPVAAVSLFDDNNIGLCIVRCNLPRG